jgi:exosortase
MLWDLWWSPSKNAGASLVAAAGAVLLAWLGRADLVASPPARTAPGLVALAVGTIAYLASVFLDFRAGVGITGVLVAGSVAWVTLGRRATRALAVPLLLLAMATPLPGAVLAHWTRLQTGFLGRVSAGTLDLLIGSVALEGFVIRMPAGEVHIVEDCSGLAAALLFWPLTVVLLFLHRPLPAVWHVLLMLAVVPLTLLATWLRIVASALLLHSGADLARSAAFHELLGIATLALSLAILLVLCAWAARHRATHGVR